MRPDSFQSARSASFPNARGSAAELARCLGARQASRQWMARCPAHDDSTPSLSIADGADGRILIHCHGGCEQETVIAELRARGLWPDERGPFTPRAIPRASAPTSHGDDAKRQEYAIGIWDQAARATDSLVGTYLRSRHINVEPPPSLRFRADLKHGQSQTTWPAMVALVQDGVTGRHVGIHRTFLSRDGSGKAPVEPQKMMLGPCRGGAVRLGYATDSLMIGEGIETCLSAMQIKQKPTWAALSAGGLRALQLPPGIRDVVILADGDAPGESAANDAARRWLGEGRAVRIARAPAGRDFNDILTANEVPSPWKVAA